jgi:hypothetical protein
MREECKISGFDGKVRGCQSCRILRLIVAYNFTDVSEVRTASVVS